MYNCARARSQRVKRALALASKFLGSTGHGLPPMCFNRAQFLAPLRAPFETGPRIPKERHEAATPYQKKTCPRIPKKDTKRTDPSHRPFAFASISFFALAAWNFLPSLPVRRVPQVCRWFQRWSWCLKNGSWFLNTTSVSLVS